MGQKVMWLLSTLNLCWHFRWTSATFSQAFPREGHYSIWYTGLLRAAREVPNAFWWCSFYPMNFYDCVSYQTRALMSLFWQSPRCKCCCLRTLDIISSYGFRIFGEIVRLDPLVQLFLTFVYKFSGWKLSLIMLVICKTVYCYF